MSISRLLGLFIFAIGLMLLIFAIDFSNREILYLRIGLAVSVVGAVLCIFGRERATD